MSRDGPSGGNPLAIVGPSGDVQGPSEDDDISNANAPVCELTNATTATGSAATAVAATTARSTDDLLPAGWEERRTTNGRSYYVNHATKSTQWERPTLPAFLCSTAAPTSKHDVTTPPSAGTSRSATSSTLSNGDLTAITPPRSAAAAAATSASVATSTSLALINFHENGPNKSKEDT